VIRKIIYGGFDSLASGLRIDSERSNTTGETVKVSEESIPYRNGGIVYPTGLDSAVLDYCFILHDAGGRQALEAKAKYIELTLYGKKGELYDNALPGKKYMNAVFVGSEPLEYVTRNGINAYMVVHFKADPVPQDLTAVNERIVKFADSITAPGTATIAVTTSGYTITKSDGTTSTGSLPTGSRKYRMTVYAENDPTITLGNDTITPETVFDLPDSGTITISGAGYGYFELWHDTRVEVSP
jgi:hypothetical protein